MDSQEINPLIRQNLLPIILGGVGLALIVFGLFQYFSHKTEEPPIVFEESKEEEVSTEVVVDVSGAVIKPGVYKLTSKSRIVDALAQAGGLSEEADREYVEKNINLAGKVTDGAKIYIPRAGEEILAQEAGGAASGPVININLASSDTLETLPGIGEVTAQKIIDGRPYSSSEELLAKKIVGEATFEKIKDKIAAN